MDSESLYLLTRANFHRRMARQAACAEARFAHDALARAYQERIDKLTRGNSSSSTEVGPGRGHKMPPVLSLALGE